MNLFEMISRYFERVGGRFTGLFLTQKKRSGILDISICTQLIIIVALIVVFEMMTNIGPAGSILLASALWTLVLFFTSAFDMWFIQPKANTAVVVANPLKRDKVLVTDKELTKLQPSETMRVLYGPTFDGKWPWEEVVNGRVVNLLRSIELKNAIDCRTKDNIKVKISWKMYLSVILSDKGIMNLVRHTEEKILGVFGGRADAYIKTIVRTLTYDDLFENIFEEDPGSGKKITVGEKTLKSAFSGMNGGDDKLIDLEWEMGMCSTYLTISDVQADEAYQEALEAKARARLNAEALDEYPNTVSRDVAANLLAGSMGLPLPIKATSHRFEGLPPNTHVVVGDLENSGK